VTRNLVISTGHLVVLLFKMVTTGSSFRVGTKRGLGRERMNMKYWWRKFLQNVGLEDWERKWMTY